MLGRNRILSRRRALSLFTVSLIVPARSQDILKPRKASGGGGGGGAVNFSDDFNRADSTSIGSNWTEANGDFGISSNTLRLNSGSFVENMAIWSGNATPNAYQYLKATIVNDAGGFISFLLRYENSSSPFYILYHDQNAGWEWYRYASVGGASTLIQSGDSGTFADGDSYGITIDGTGNSTVIRIWKNPTANTPVSASEWDSGDTTPELSLTNDPASPCDAGRYLGIGGSVSGASTAAFDNFYGGGS